MLAKFRLCLSIRFAPARMFYLFICFSSPPLCCNRENILQHYRRTRANGAMFVYKVHKVSEKVLMIN